MREQCPFCARKLVNAIGPKDSPILLVGSVPGYKEVIEGEPWVGPAGRVLKNELARAGLQFDKCRVTNLWLHEPVRPGTKARPNELYPEEYEFHKLRLQQELRGREAVLVMGKEAYNAFSPGSIVAVAGTRIGGPSFPASVKVAIAMQNPALAIHSTLGETRLAIQRFADYIDDAAI